MPVSFKHNALFVHIPKTGGQSISKMLGIPKNSHRDYYAEGLTHLDIKQLEERIDISNMYIFAFVRNPYDRIISEYHWRMRNRHSAVFNEPTKNQVSFEKYMELLVERFPHIEEVEWRTRAHITPQSWFIDDRVDVYRFENFGYECERLKERFGIIGPTPHVNGAKYNTIHTRRTLDITNNLYISDFVEFNYEMR